MAAMVKQLWPPFLLHLFPTLFSLLLLFPYHSLSLFDYLQNIKTFFPNATLSPQSPSPPVPLPQRNPPPSSSSDRQKLTRAVLITAASTLLVAVVLLFFVHKYVISRRRDRAGVENNLPPDLPLAEAALAREGFTRFGNVKGLILDENGIDVLYWRKSQRDNKTGSFRKERVHGEDDNKKNVIHSNNIKKSETVTEIPLLRGRSSTSHSVIHNEYYLNATSTAQDKTESFQFANSALPTPPPIPVKQTAPVPPPPPHSKPVSGKNSPPPPLNKTATLSSSASKLPPATKGSSTVEGSSARNGQVKTIRGSFSFDGDLMEALFGYVAVRKNFPEHGGDKKTSSTSPSQIFILDQRKSQNTAVVLKSQNTAEHSRTQLLEAILKSGNRMNAGTARGDAQAFTLTAVLNLSNVKSVDGKTTLLNFVVEEVVRSEGKRCLLNRRTHRSSSISEVISKEEQEKEYLRLGLPLVGGLSSEFSNVKKAADIDYDTLSATCLTLSSKAKDSKRVLTQCEGENREVDMFVKEMTEFLDSVEEEVKLAREEEKRVMELVKRTTEYYQAGTVKEKNPIHLFIIVKEFLVMIDKICVEIARKLQRRTIESSTEELY